MGSTKMAIGHHMKEVREGHSTSTTSANTTNERNANKAIAMSRTEMNITKDRLRQQLMKRLDETGWRHQMRLQVQDLVHEKGTDKATIEDIVQELAPKANTTISEEIKRELVIEAKTSLKESDYT